MDSDNTHNFLDMKITKKFGCLIEEHEPCWLQLQMAQKIQFLLWLEMFHGVYNKQHLLLMFSFTFNRLLL